MEVTQNKNVPVIAIDGGAGTGKGTIRQLLGVELPGWNMLDSGVLYRAVAVVCKKQRLSDVVDIVNKAKNLNVRVDGEDVFVDGVNETAYIRSDEIGKLASIISQDGNIRNALKRYQLEMRQLPGLIAEGRDMCFLFNTPYRYFLIASPKVRAVRRVRQLRDMGIFARYESVLAEILRRDQIDRERLIQPLIRHKGAVEIDTTDLEPKDVVSIILEDFREKYSRVKSLGS